MAKRCACIFSSGSARSVVAERELAVPAVRRTWLKPARRRLVQALKDDMKHVMADMKHVMAEVQKVAAGETPFFQVGGCAPLPAVRRSWLHEAAACPPRVGLPCFPCLRALDAGAGGRRARGHAVAAPHSRLRRLRQPVCCVRAGHMLMGM